jgi:hypothetical protein
MKKGVLGSVTGIAVLLAIVYFIEEKTVVVSNTQFTNKKAYCRDGIEIMKYSVKDRTPLYIETSSGSTVKLYLKPNSVVKGCFDNDRSFKTSLDEQGKQVPGFISWAHLSDGPTTTIQDFNKYYEAMKKKETFINDLPPMQYVVANPQKFKGKYVLLNLYGPQIEQIDFIGSSRNSEGITFQLFDAEKGRYFFEAPFKELAEDWEREWEWNPRLVAQGDYFVIIGKLGKVSSFVNALGQTFTIPVIEVTGIYDCYRFLRR